MSKAVSVVGDGESSRRNTNALLKDFVQGFEEPTTFVLPVSGPWFTDAVRHVADWVMENKSSTVDLTFIADEHDLPDLSDYESVTVTEVEDVPDALALSDTVIVAWYDNEDFEGWVEGVLKSGTPVLDLTDGLYPIEYTPDEPADTQSEGEQIIEPDPEPTPEPEPQVEPEPQRAKTRETKPRSRAARNAAKTQAEEPSADEFYKEPEGGQAATYASADNVHGLSPEERDEATAQRAAEIVLERLKTALG